MKGCGFERDAVSRSLPRLFSFPGAPTATPHRGVRRRPADEPITMLATACPRCGKPMPLSLATPEVAACSACDFSGSPPPEITAELRAAASSLAELRAEERQLDQAQRAAIGKTSWERSGMATVFGTALAPQVFIALLGGALFLGQEKPSWELFGFSLVPLGVAGLAAILASRPLARRRREMQAACLATPPPRDGEPLGCHVCGGPLPEAALAQAVVRCGFCQSDNLVDRSILASLGQAQRVVLSHFAETIQREASRFRVARDSAKSALILAALVAPLFGVASAVAVAITLASITAETRGDTEYTFVERPEGNCLALVTRYHDHLRLSFGATPPTGFAHFDRPNADGLTIVHVGAIVGNHVRGNGLATPGRVTSVHGTWLGTNVAVVRAFGSDKTDEVSPEGLCVIAPTDVDFSPHGR